MARKARKPAPYLITGARVSRPALIDARKRRYLIAMGIRTACFLLAIIVFRGWLRWAALAVAIVLPYASVIGANAVPPPPDDAPRYFVPEHRTALDASPASSEESTDRG